jgi:hypothetical protein
VTAGARDDAVNDVMVIMPGATLKGSGREVRPAVRPPGGASKRGYKNGGEFHYSPCKRALMMGVLKVEAVRQVDKRESFREW